MAGATSETELVKSIPNIELSWEQGTEFVVIRTVVIADSIKGLSNFYPFKTNDAVLATWGARFSGGLYAWEIQAFLPISASLRSSQGHLEG